MKYDEFLQTKRGVTETCAIDFTTPIRSGTGNGVNEDGTVDACLVQRSYLRAWCRAHPDSPLTEIVGVDVPDDEPTVSRVIRSFAIALNDGLPDAERQRLVPYEERQYAAARKAADAVFAEKLGETIVALRDEAFQLFDDMIAVGREAVPA